MNIKSFNQFLLEQALSSYDITDHPKYKKLVHLAKTTTRNSIFSKNDARKILEFLSLCKEKEIVEKILDLELGQWAELSEKISLYEIENLSMGFKKDAKEKYVKQKLNTI